MHELTDVHSWYDIKTFVHKDRMMFVHGSRIHSYIIALNKPDVQYDKCIAYIISWGIILLIADI